MYGKSYLRRASKYWRHNPIHLQICKNTRRSGAWRTYSKYHASRGRRSDTFVPKNLSLADGMVGSLFKGRLGRRKYPLRLLEARAAHELWENFTKLTVRRQCSQQTQSRFANGSIRRNQQVTQNNCTSQKRTPVATPHLRVSPVRGNETTTPGFFRRQEWTLLAPYLTPLELIRLSHTHKLQVPDICWQQAWHHGKVPCYRTACRVHYLVDKHSAMALANSILTVGAAMRAFAALWQLEQTEACIALARFPRVHRLIVTRYRREKIRRNLKLD